LITCDGSIHWVYTYNPGTCMRSGEGEKEEDNDNSDNNDNKIVINNDNIN